MTKIKNAFSFKDGEGFTYKAGRFPYLAYYKPKEDDEGFSVVLFADHTQGAVDVIAGLIAYANTNGGGAPELEEALLKDELVIEKMTINSLFRVELDLEDVALGDVTSKAVPFYIAPSPESMESKKTVENTSPEAVKTSDSLDGSNVKDGEISSSSSSNETDEAKKEFSQVAENMSHFLETGELPSERGKTGELPNPDKDDLNKAGLNNPETNS